MIDRQRLPDRRKHELFVLRHGDFDYTVGIGRFADGRIGEVFLDVSKSGTELQTQARDAAVMLSLMLQHDFPIDIVRHAVTRSRDGSAAGPIGALLDHLFGKMPPTDSPDVLASPVAPVSPAPAAADLEHAE